MLQFTSNDSVILICNNKISVFISVALNCAVYLGKNQYTNNKVCIRATERTNVIIGDNCVFSTGIELRTSDAHPIYDSISGKRINHSKSIYIGDHVWIGMDCLFLKGSRVGSGSIIAARAVVANKTIPSNCIWGGNPSKLIKKNVFFTDNCVHKYTETQSMEINQNSDTKYIFQYDPEYNNYINDLEKKRL